MSNGMQESEAMQMPSQESSSVNEERKSSSICTRRLTREEGRALIERHEAIAEEFMQYLKEHNMLPKKCPARKAAEQPDEQTLTK